MNKSYSETLKPKENTDNIVSKNKSMNKAAGLKSTLISDDKLYMTSFGKGNSAVVEHQIDTINCKSKPIENTPSIYIENVDETKVLFSSKRPFVNQDQDSLRAYNPLHKGKRKKDEKDNLGLKDSLEKRYFGQVFNDNIHIQIIYNILDIEKIIARYATSISATINHFIDDKMDIEIEDFIGYISTINTYDTFENPDGKVNDKKAVGNIKSSREKFNSLLKSKRLSYFGLNYEYKNKQECNDIRKHLYHLMAFAGGLRQWSFHSNSKSREWLYKIDSDAVDKEYRDTLDYYFDNRFNEINEGFIEKNKVNLYILKKISELEHKNFKDIAELYYDFIVVKTYKNIGFSIKKLREKMLDREEADKITDKSVDSVRDKLYKLIDFWIFYNYYSEPNRCEENVSKLRACMDEEEKELFYDEEAKRLWKKYKSVFISFLKDRKNIVKRIEKDKKEYYTDRRTNEKLNFNEILKCINIEKHRNYCQVSYFSKLMYVICFFLDGKEINDLLTTLINKFDNIASLIKVARDIGINIKFIPDYSFFENSSKYVKELCIVKNISRMKKPDARAKKVLFRDALYILGIPSDINEEKLEDEIDKYLNTKENHGFRNFISNNVINSNRFIYVVKYCNTKKVREISKNKKVINFVLGNLPSEQINRYYLSCVENADKYVSDNDKIGSLSELICNMDFKSFIDVNQNINNKNSVESQKKERYKAIIGLYLNVVYQLIKNLVNINSRYVIAFHCLERDSELYDNKRWDKKYNKIVEVLYDEKLSKNGEYSKNIYIAKNRKQKEYIKENMKKVSNDILTLYRNNVAHLTAIRNCFEFINDIEYVDSYFGLYHYLMQRQICKKTPNTAINNDIKDYFQKLLKYNTYVKDFVKVLNTPFGYNTPRYKNLSIKECFDMNEKSTNKLDKTKEMCYN